MTFANARLFSIFCLTVISVLFVREYANPGFLDYSNPIETGLFLYAIIVYLLFLNVRKRFPYLPIFKVSKWLRWHVYAGWFSFVVFFTHIGFKMPNGVYERTLAVLFLATGLSGVIGAFLSKLIPRLLTANGGAHVFDSIPIKVREIRDEAQEMALNSIKETEEKTLASFYSHRLAPFFHIQKFSWRVVFNAKADLTVLMRETDYLCRYLNANELEVLESFRKMIIRKSYLDYHYSLLLIMRYWLFFHVPMSYGLLIIGGFHGFLAYTFTGN